MVVLSRLHYGTLNYFLKKITEFKALLSEHGGSKNNEKTFKQLVERVCLAKRYLARRKRTLHFKTD